MIMDVYLRCLSLKLLASSVESMDKLLVALGKADKLELMD